MNSAKLFLSLLAASVCGSVLTAYVMRPEQKTVPKPEAPEPVSPVTRSARQLQTDFSGAIHGTMPAVVLITAQKRIGVMTPYSNIYDYSRRRIDYMDVPSGQGSGFFIREDGYILTNYHVVRNQDSFWITTHSGEEFPAQVVGIDPPTDLALLKVNEKKKFPVLKFAEGNSVEIGHWAIAIGAPFSLSRTVTVGIVSNKKRNGVGMNLYESYVQTDASINPGNSGGPLLNINGEVIGVNDFILSPSGGNIGLSFAISSDIAKKVSDELISRGHVERPWLGILMQPIDRDAKKRLGLEHGVFVSQIFRGSPAAGKLRRGDVVLKANGEPVNAPHDLQGAVFALSPNSELKLEIRRGSQIQTITLTVTKSPRNWFRMAPDQESGSIPVRQL